MWLVVSFLAALIVSAAYLLSKELRKERYKIGFLALMLWGTFVMVLVDHAIGFMEGGEFIEVTTDGLIQNGALLGVAMILPLLAIWVGAVCTPLGERLSI